MKRILNFIIILLFSIFMISCDLKDDFNEVPNGDDNEESPNIEVPKEEDKFNEIKYINPVFEPILADPAIIKAEDGYFYAFGTADYGLWGDEYDVKFGPIIRSKNLVNWDFVGEVFEKNSRPDWGNPHSGIWAPDVVKFGDTYNYYYSLSIGNDPNPGIGVATAPHPTGPWTDHGKMFTSLEIGVNHSIDPAVFFDPNGTPYMIWGSYRGLYGGKLSNDGLKFLDPNIKFSKTHVAGYHTATPFNPATYEAAYIIYIDRYYYMFVSSGNCCGGHNSSYNVKVARSTSPLGPYYDHNGNDMFDENRGYQVLQASNKTGGPGHNSIIQDDSGDYWIVYHAFDKSKPETVGGTQRRSLYLDKLVWNSAGWPSVEGLVPSATELVGPRLKLN